MAKIEELGLPEEVTYSGQKYRVLAHKDDGFILLAKHNAKEGEGIKIKVGTDGYNKIFAQGDTTPVEEDSEVTDGEPAVKVEKATYVS